jgi:hypothetical protein
MNGVDCVEALRAVLASKTLAIVLTGDIRSQALDAISKHDINIAIKPIKGDDLLQLISRVCGAARFRPGIATKKKQTDPSGKCSLPAA